MLGAPERDEGGFDGAATAGDGGELPVAQHPAGPRDAGDPDPPAGPTCRHTARRTGHGRPGGRGRREPAAATTSQRTRRRRTLADPRAVGPARAPRPVDPGLAAT